MAQNSAIREAMERMPSGVFIAATRATEGNLLAIIATWAMQVSFVPPLVALALEKGSRFAGEVERSGEFSLSLLPDDGIMIAKKVLKQGPELRDPALVREFSATPGGAPALTCAAASLVCRFVQFHDAGDHLIGIGEVLSGTVSTATGGLMLEKTGWKYRPKRG
jgi:flavin reductase (DIM6/NTAB) family NADH-FMN oxidoreductase RutF